MPLVTAAYLVLVAGLLAGFGGHGGPTTWISVALAATAAARRDARTTGLALVVAAGALVAEATLRADAACRDRVAAGVALEVVLHEPAAPGRLVRGEAAAGCPLRATVAVVAGSAAAGEVVRARGAIAASDGRAHVRDARVVSTGERRALPALRDRAARTIDRLFGADSAVARALLVADARDIPPEVRDRFADAGLVHVLSVSGLHVSIVAAALELLVAARLPRQAAASASVVAVALYVAVLGAPPPAVRAAVMLGALALSRAVQRNTSPWAIVALGGLVPLVDPRTVRDLGYALSMAGMAALVAGGAVARRLLDRRPPGAGAGRSGPAIRSTPPLRGWRRTVARELAVGIVATLVTAPLVAWYFGRLSLVGPLANLAAGPVVAILQPTLFLALALAPFGAVGMLAADAARPLLRALDAVAGTAASMPGASVAVAPTLAAAVLLGGAAAALLVACAARRPARPAIACAGCVAASAWLPLAPGRSTGHAELHLLDVGQGDAVAVRTPRGRWVLFDAGRSWRGGDAGRRTVVPYLRRRGGSLAALVLSHPHADHVGGAATVVRALRPRDVVDAAFVLGGGPYRDALAAARGGGARWRRVRPGDSLVVDGVVIDFLAPDSAWTASLRDPNLASVVASVRFGGVRFLLVGDAEGPEERWLLRRAREDPWTAARLRADVLKVGHHGSATSTTPEFVAAVRPRVALVSVGEGNRYGHPSRAVLGRLAAGGAEILRTDRSGSVVVRTDGRSITLNVGSVTWEVRQPGEGGDGAGGAPSPRR